MSLKLWTVKEIIDLTGFGERTIRRAISRADEGQTDGLVAERIGRSRRVRHAQLIAWMGFDPLLEPSVHYRAPKHPNRSHPSSDALPRLFDLN